MKSYKVEFIYFHIEENYIQDYYVDANSEQEAIIESKKELIFPNSDNIIEIRVSIYH